MVNTYCSLKPLNLTNSSSYIITWECREISILNETKQFLIKRTYELQTFQPKKRCESMNKLPTSLNWECLPVRMISRITGIWTYSALCQGGGCRLANSVRREKKRPTYRKQRKKSVCTRQPKKREATYKRRAAVVIETTAIHQFTAKIRNKRGPEQMR